MLAQLTELVCKLGIPPHLVQDQALVVKHMLSRLEESRGALCHVDMKEAHLHSIYCICVLLHIEPCKSMGIPVFHLFVASSNMSGIASQIYMPAKTMLQVFADDAWHTFTDAL